MTAALLVVSWPFITIPSAKKHRATRGHDKVLEWMIVRCGLCCPTHFSMGGTEISAPWNVPGERVDKLTWTWCVDAGSDNA